MIYYILWAVSLIGLILGIFWVNLLFFKESKRINLKTIPYVSVIIPAYNEGKTIKNTLNSLLKLNYPKDKIEIVVVNDESKDNTAEVVKKFKNVKLIYNKHRGIGKASAVNKGIKYAKGEFIAIVDADSEVSKDSLKKVLEHFSSDKVGGVITPIKVLGSDNVYKGLQRIEYTFTAMIRELMSRINTLYYSHGVLSVFKKNIIEKLGGFDENNLTEDLEIAMRLKANGYDVRMASNALTYTRVPSKFWELWNQRVRWYRGFMQNLVRYRKVLFRKKYGLYGNFQLPLNLFSLIVLAFVFVFFLYELITKIYNWISKIIVQKFEIFLIGELPSVKETLLSFDIKYFFPLIIVILINLYLFYKASKIMKQKTRFFSLTILVYFIIFPILTMFHWVTALFQEIFNMRKKW